MGRRKELTNDQIKHVRANQMRSASQILTRFSKYALGTLEGELTAAQIKAGAEVIKVVVPAQQAVAWTDETEHQDLGSLQDNLAQAASQLTTDDIKALLGSLPASDLQAVIDSDKGTEH